MDLSQPTTSTDKTSSSDYTSESDSEQSPEPPRNIPENYEKELENNLSKQRLKRPNSRKNLSKIPVHLKGLMGEANLRFARGDYKTAERMCFEVIRQVRHAFEPYATLSQLYEGTDQEKSLQYLTIAAHLNPSDVNMWVRLAEIYEAQGNVRGAVTCFTRAIRADPKNIALHKKRIELLVILDDLKMALKCKVHLLNVYDTNDVEELMKLAKELAECYHKQKEFVKALEVFNIPFIKCREFVTPEMVNIYLELLLINNSFPACLDVFVQFCNIEMEIEIDDEGKIIIISYNIPQNLQVDLHSKFIICLIKLDSIQHAKNLLQPMLLDEANAENLGDLYLDIAEAFMSQQKHAEALTLLVPLIKSKNFSLAAIWLKHAECLEKCGMDEQAVESYYTVIKLAPQHHEVRTPLSNLLLKNQRPDEAVDVLKQDPEFLDIDVRLLIKCLNLQRELKLTNDYFDSVDLFLRRHCIEFNHVSELKIATLHQTVKDKIVAINKLRDLRFENHIQMDLSCINEPPVDEEFAVYKDILNFCYKNRHYAQMKKYAFMGLTSTRFKAYFDEVIIYTLYACIFSRDFQHSHTIVRNLLINKYRLKSNNYLWNLLTLTIQIQSEHHRNRFFMRHLRATDKSLLKLLEVTHAISMASFKIASVYLMPFLRTHPTPFIYMILGVVFLQLCMQKHVTMKKKLTQCTYGLFLNYASYRGKEAHHEVCYNLGRMYHAYGILHIAQHYYKLVLEYKHPLIDENPDILDLKKEAAFNLYLIYCDSENFIGARNLLHKYLTIE